MTTKKDYYDLDKIGYIGSQRNRTSAQIKREIADTVEYVKANKSSKITPASKKMERKLLKRK